MPIAENKLPGFSAPYQPLPDEPEGPGVRETLGAAFRLDNSVVAAYDLLTRPAYKYDPNFDLVKALKGTELWEDREFFVGTFSQEEFEDRAARVIQEKKDRETRARAGFGGFVASTLAGVASLTSLIPLTAGARGAKAIVQGAALGFSAGAVDEAVLYGAQETRTTEEVLVGIGATTILGGILGGGASALRTRAMRHAAYDMAGKPGFNAISETPVFIRGADDAIPAIEPASGTYRFARSVAIPDGPGPVSLRPEPTGTAKTVSYEFTPRSALVITPQSARALDLPTDRAALEAFARENDHDAIVFQGFDDAPDELFEQYGTGRVQFKNLSPADQEAAKAIPGLRLKKDGTPRADATVDLESLAKARDPEAVRGPEDEILVLDRAALRQVDDPDKVTEFPQFGSGVVNVPASLSSAGLRSASAGGLAPAAGGTAAQRTLARWSGPVTQTLFQDVLPQARWMMAQLSDAGVRLQRNVAGVPTTLGGTVENRVKIWYGNYWKAVQKLDEDYLNYYYAGRPMPQGLAVQRARLGQLLDPTRLSKSEFRNEVSRAMRSGEHEIPEVLSTAQFFRQEIFEPMRKELVDAELIPEEVRLLGDNEYLFRTFNRAVIEQKPQEFVDLIAGHLHDNLVDDFNKQLARLLETERRGRVRAKDLNMTYRKATELREKFKADLAKLTAEPDEATRTFAPHVKREEHVAILRAQAREASPQARKDLMAQARALEAQGGEAFERFRGKKAELRRRIRNLDQNRFALAEKQRKKYDKVDRAEELNLNALNRTVRSAQKSLRDLAKWDDTKLDQEVSRLKNLFADTAKKYDTGEERIGRLTEAEEAPRPVSQGEADALARLHARAEELEIDDLTDPRLDSEREALDEATASEPVRFSGGGVEAPSTPAKEPELQVKKHGSNVFRVSGGRAHFGQIRKVGRRWHAEIRETDSGDLVRNAGDWDLKRDAVEEVERLVKRSELQVAPEEVVPEITPARPQAAEGLDPRAGETFRQMDRADRLTQIAQRLESAEALDRAEVRRLINEGLQEVLKKTNRINSRRALRAERLRAQAEKLAPERIRAEIKAIPEQAKARRLALQDALREKGADEVDLDQGTVDFRRFSVEIGNDVRSKILGENIRFAGMDLIQGERGPMRARALNIPSAKIDEFLENDIELVSRLYLRATAPDLEITRKLGGPNAGVEFTRLREEYDELLEAAKGDPARTAEIRREYGRATEHLKAVIGRLRHTWGIPDNPAGAANRLGRAVLNLNVLRLMGNVAIASLQDPARIVMRQGMGPFRESFMGLITGMKEAKLSMREAKLSGTALDPVLHTRAHALMEVMDDLHFRGTKAERALEYATSRMGIVSLFDYWTSWIKQQAAIAINARLLSSIDEVLNTATPSREAVTFLAESGLDERLMRLIWKETTSAEGGNRVNGVWLPNTESWTDREALFAYRAALNREIDATVITPGVERPLWMDRTIPGRIMGQFKSFTFSSTTKTLMAGLQHPDASFLTGVLLSTALGMMSYYLWAVSVGGEAQEEMMNASWEKWLDEAIDRSGVTGVLGLGREGLQTVPGIGRVTEAVPPLGLISSFSGERFSQRGGRGLAGVFTPPTVDAFNRLTQVVSGIDDPTAGTARAARNLLPYQNVFYLRRLFTEVEKAADLPEKRESR